MIAGWSSQVAHRAHNPKVRGSNPLPATIYIFNNISIFRRYFYLKNRSLYFHTPRYTPHTFQFFLTSLLFQTQEVQTNPTWCCLRHSKPQQLFKEHSFITNIFVELTEQGSVAKVHRIEIVLSLGEKILVKGPGEQNELFRLSRTSRLLQAWSLSKRPNGCQANWWTWQQPIRTASPVPAALPVRIASIWP